MLRNNVCNLFYGNHLFHASTVYQHLFSIYSWSTFETLLTVNELCFMLAS